MSDDSDLKLEEVSDVEENKQGQLPSVEEYAADTAAGKIRPDLDGKRDIDDANMKATIKEGFAIESGDCDDTCLSTDDEGGLKPALNALKPALASELCNKRICWATLFLVVLLAITTTTVAKIITKENTPRSQAVLNFLVENEISTSCDLENVESPQYHAANWIADNDGMKLDIPQYGEHIAFVERYVMAVFFYALDGPHWKHDLNFLSPNHICTWYEEFKEDVTSGAGVHGCVKVDNKDLLAPFSLYLRK
jgi:hypothetical protein